MTAAWIAGIPLQLSDVDSREQAIRSGPASTALPSQDSSEGRQLRRWLVQLMAAERLVAAEAEARNLTEVGAPPLEDLADRPGMLQLGSVAAALLAQSPLARAVFLAVTNHVRVEPDRIKRYYDSNPELFTEPDRTRAFDEARAGIERTLLALDRRRAFLAWLDAKTAELVRLAPGYEHPGDPSQPDNTHRH
jgi:[acyl-carrier-protein] S-malonyltransferase